MPGIRESRQRAVNVRGLREVRGGEGCVVGLSLGLRGGLVLRGRQELHGVGPDPVAELCEPRVKPATITRHGQHARKGVGRVRDSQSVGLSLFHG